MSSQELQKISWDRNPNWKPLVSDLLKWREARLQLNNARLMSEKLEKQVRMAGDGYQRGAGLSGLLETLPERVHGLRTESRAVVSQIDCHFPSINNPWMSEP